MNKTIKKEQQQKGPFNQERALCTKLINYIKCN